MIVNFNDAELRELVKDKIPLGFEIRAVTKASGVRGGINIYCEKVDS